MKTLKDLGAGKSKLEHVILDEANTMCDHLQKEVGSKPIEVNTYFNIIILNILWTVVGGKRYCIKNISRTFVSMTSLGLILVIQSSRSSSTTWGQPLAAIR